MRNPSLHSCFFNLWHYYPYILQNFNEMFFLHLYAARQGIRACNNNNMHNPSLYLFYFGVTVVACFHLLSCIYTALIPCLATCMYTCFASYILHLFLYFFGTVIPTSFNTLMEMFLLPLLCLSSPGLQVMHCLA